MSPRRCLTALILAFSLSIVGLAPLASGSSGLDARDMEQAVADVSGERMMSTIRDLEAFGSRAFYLPSSLDAAAYIYDRLEQLGLYVTYQYFSVQDFAAVNVVATLNGTSEGAPQYLFGAHFDSENMFADTYSEGENYSAPGADDDASGVAAVIELATLMAGMEFENTVKFVAFDAEEYGFDQIGGLKGSAHFASVEKAAKARYAGTAILDMIGWKQGSDNVAFGIVNVDNDRMAMATEDSVERFGIDLTFTSVTAPTLRFSDHSSFWDAGYPSMLVMEELAYPSLSVLYPYYHTTSDTSDKVSPDQTQEVTRALLGAVLILLVNEGSSILLVVAGAAASVAVVALVTGVLYFRSRRKKEKRE